MQRDFFLAVLERQLMPPEEVVEVNIFVTQGLRVTANFEGL